MGQALRRAAGKLRASNAQPPAQQLKNAERRPPAPPVDRPPAPMAAQDGFGVPDTEDFSRNKEVSGILEERDPTYDAMLSKMVGRITTKPGGKPEMGEVAIVERYNRPLPKLRSSKPEPGYHEEKPVPAGTLNVAQLKEIIQLHEGKPEDHHQGPKEVEDIAKRYRIDVAEVQKILRFVSLPPEEINGKSQQDQ